MQHSDEERDSDKRPTKTAGDMVVRVLKQAVRVYDLNGRLVFHLHGAEHVLAPSARNELRAEAVRRGFVSDDPEFTTWLDRHGFLEAVRAASTLPERFLERHDRTLRYLASSERENLTSLDMLTALHASRVLVIGLGGVGSWIAHSLLMSGIGTVIAVDGDDVEASNLNRSALYGPGDIGLSKVDAASRSLDSLFPDQNFIGHRAWIDSTRSVTKFAAGVDFVVSAADTPHRLIRMWVREGSRLAGVPVIETMGGAIGPIRGSNAVPYDYGVSVDGSGTAQVPLRNLNAVARGPGVPPFHPMTDAAGVCQAIFETLSHSRASQLSNGYLRKGALVNLGAFHAMTPKTTADQGEEGHHEGLRRGVGVRALS